MEQRVSKYLMSLASGILVIVYLLPIWKISISAPQYPEGLGMYIWINEITGENRNDLKTINGLNHYIGMKEINPASIPELKIMPYVIGFFIVSGFVLSFKPQKNLILAWAVLFMLAGVIGLYDYYIWGYDYGHDLSSDAPIKIPGMSYQPPLVGRKQLLNINTTSLPYFGSYVIFISILSSLISYYLLRRKRK